jgi:fucose permease
VTSAAISAAPFPLLRRSAAATGAVFALSGSLQSTWVSRLPEVRAHLDAATGPLGIALLGSAVGSIVSTFLTGRMVRRFSSRTVVAVMCALSNVALLGLGLVHSVVQLGLVLVVYGFGYGSWDVAMNVHGHAVEAAARRPWMPRYHAAWSVGGFAFAGVGALAAGVHLPIPVHFGLVGICSTLGVLGCLTLFFDDRDVPADDVPAAPAARLFTTHLVVLGIVMACSTLIEGAASDWLGIYFDDVRGVAPAAGAAAYTTFAVAMATGRGAGTWTIAWLGRARAVRFSGVLALIGVALLLLSPFVAGAYVGAALWGIGTAIVFPAVISAAGDTPGRSAEAISAVTPIGYSGFLFGPPLIGLLAQSIGLNRALWVVGALALVMVVCAGAARENVHAPPEPAPVE